MDRMGLMRPNYIVLVNNLRRRFCGIWGKNSYCSNCVYLVSTSAASKGWILEIELRVFGLVGNEFDTSRHRNIRRNQHTLGLFTGLVPSDLQSCSFLP